jgi:PIN domain nuclease of toxin-antitoxin system
MQLLLDTHIIVWIVLDDKRLSKKQRAMLKDSDNELLVSPVIAYELTDLQKRGRIPLTEPISVLQELIGFELAELPASTWEHVASLPNIHRDPVDRMLIAHALAEGMTLVTSDSKIRQYPVQTLW